MELLTIASFLGAAIILTLAPGPDNLFVLAQSIGKGKNAGVYTTLGLCTGILVHITAATIGLSAIIYHSTLAFNIVKYAGATYLLYLAYKSFRDKGGKFDLKTEDSLNYRALYKRGIIMNLLNPKVALFFLAFFPQFINYETGSVSVQMLVYGFLFLFISLVIFVLISLFAGKAGNLLRKSPTISRKINLVQGTLFAIIGLNIAFSQK
ncbi:LysE family translocator [Salinicoccus halodurans]|uniref:Threonine transporter RhtB n=1 Tax=Salinicoccus halodurans TaxID=407035 RepID=A0A0F7HL43_9STAP|nr:LysE family translocator [Salinicoccus halodurans]AKG73551.1 threonine transporter RhtB [Salinicoccus halodurans]SFK52436.1 Threonine/homoserine/homoserine lactone efflux protein [Salinicoccus halodurans]